MRVKARKTIRTAAGEIKAGEEVELVDREAQLLLNEKLADPVPPRSTWPQKLDGALKAALKRFGR